MVFPSEAKTITASWYEDGHTTANGEPFNPDGISCAHKTLPFDTMVRLTYKGKTIKCRINDRGPFVKGREIDLSRGAAKALGCYHVGVCRGAEMTVLG